MNTFFSSHPITKSEAVGIYFFANNFFLPHSPLKCSNWSIEEKNDHDHDTSSFALLLLLCSIPAVMSLTLAIVAIAVVHQSSHSFSFIVPSRLFIYFTYLPLCLPLRLFSVSLTAWQPSCSLRSVSDSSQSRGLSAQLTRSKLLDSWLISNSWQILWTLWLIVKSWDGQWEGKKRANDDIAVLTQCPIRTVTRVLRE